MPLPDKGRNLDVSSESGSSESRSGERAFSDLDNCPTSASQKRPFVGVEFDCCSIYTRVYVNAEGTAYEGNCPRCGKPVRLKIGPGGTSSRFFRAT